MWRGPNVGTRRRICEAWRKKAPILARNPRRWNQLQGQSLPPFARWRLAGSRAHQVSGKRQTPVPLWAALCSTRRKSSTVSPVTWKCKQTCKRAAGQSLSACMDKGIITDFAKKARSQLIREKNVMAARALDFLVCGAITKLACLRMDLFPINFSVCVATGEPCLP